MPGLALHVLSQTHENGLPGVRLSSEVLCLCLCARVRMRVSTCIRACVLVCMPAHVSPCSVLHAEHAACQVACRARTAGSTFACCEVHWRMCLEEHRPLVYGPLVA